jgi:uncharacterized protein YuzE
MAELPFKLFRTNISNDKITAENVIIDLDKKGHIIAIEVVDASKNIGKELVTKILNTEKLATVA